MKQPEQPREPGTNSSIYIKALLTLLIPLAACYLLIPGLRKDDASLLFCGLILSLPALAVLGLHQSRLHGQRLQALKREAAALELHYYPGDTPHISSRYNFFRTIRFFKEKGVEDVFLGWHRGRRILFFNFKDQDYAAAILHLPAKLPALFAWPTHGPQLGMDLVLDHPEVDLDNIIFSECFKTKSSSKKLTYDIFHPRTMELFLKAKTVHFELVGDAMLLCLPGSIEPGSLSSMRHNILLLWEKFPNYMFHEGKSFSDPKAEKKELA